MGACPPVSTKVCEDSVGPRLCECMRRARYVARVRVSHHPVPETCAEARAVDARPSHAKHLEAPDGTSTRVTRSVMQRCC